MPGYAFCTAVLICDFTFASFSLQEHASFQLGEQPRLKKRVETKAFAPLSILVSFWTYLQLWPFIDLGTLGNREVRKRSLHCNCKSFTSFMTICAPSSPPQTMLKISHQFQNPISTLYRGKGGEARVFFK